MEKCNYKSKVEVFLDENLFPILLPALKNTIDEAKKKNYFERRNVRFSMKDYFMDEISQTSQENSFFSNLFEKYERSNINDEEGWSEFDSALAIQSFWRGFTYRRNKKLAPLRCWQKEWREMNEEKKRGLNLFRTIVTNKEEEDIVEALKRDQCYDNIRITKSSWDSTYCSVNPRYLAVITEAAGGGSFLVLPIENVGRVDRETPLVVGHKAAVLDIQWCPHDDSIIASASEDCTVKVWQIPEGGLTENLVEPVVDLVAHQRRVGLVVWHPTAENILLSGGSDNKVLIWNVSTASIVSEVTLSDVPLSASWSWDGSALVVSCRDRKVRVIEPRSGDIKHGCTIKFNRQEQTCHEGGKATQVCYIKDGRILTTGFSKRSERQVSLWSETLESLSSLEIDNSNGVLYIYYDPDTGIFFLCGKGDSMMRYFEVTDQEPFIHYLNCYSSSDPQRGVAFMPKRGLNVNICEIARYYKIHTKGLCEVIPMTVPRKSELFQDDLYPDTAGDEAAMTAQEWISGKNATPVMVSLKDGYVSKKKHGGFSKGFVKPTATGDSSGDAELKKQVHELKEQLQQKEDEIKELKARLQKYEE